MTEIRLKSIQYSHSTYFSLFYKTTPTTEWSTKAISLHDKIYFFKGN